MAVLGKTDINGGLNVKGISKLQQDGVSTSWIYGRDTAIIKTTSYSGYNCATSLKTSNGSWETGVYNDNLFYINYTKDSDYSSGNNSVAQYVFTPSKSGTVATTSDVGTKVSKSGDTMSGNLRISHNTSADMSFSSNNPSIEFSENGNQPVKLMYTDYDSYRAPAGLKIIGNQSGCWLEVNGNIYGSEVHGAVWNDLVDKIIVSEDTKLEYGKCFYTDGKEYKQTNRYCQKGVIGIHSDTFGFSMGNVENKTQLNVSVAGFVLAFTDKKYKSGTPLTCTKDGYLTKISLWDKIIYPERIVGTYWKDETQDEWNGVKVNNRNWIKIK